jgi:hypothetical protein
MLLFYARSSKIAGMMPIRRGGYCLLLSIALSACAPFVFLTQPSDTPTVSSLPATPALETGTVPPVPLESATPEARETLQPTASETGTATPSLTATSTILPTELALDPADWHNWPILPIVPQRAKLIYLYGQALGNDPNAFSVLGDCQAEPDIFMGVYETDVALVDSLPEDLQETVEWFRGSFNRMSPTVKPSTTTAALLWPAWHKNAYTCTEYETPVACELRLHKPAFALIHVGTHYESHNDNYMRQILDVLIEAGVVPILYSKADNREYDEQINLEYAQLAVEYDIPFWNFWSALVSLENRGLYTKTDVFFQGDVYMTKQALMLHRLTALQTLDVVRRAVMGE